MVWFSLGDRWLQPDMSNARLLLSSRLPLVSVLQMTECCQSPADLNDSDQVHIVDECFVILLHQSLKCIEHFVPRQNY